MTRREPTSWYFWISRPPRTTAGPWWIWCAGWRRRCSSLYRGRGHPHGGGFPHAAAGGGGQDSVNSAAIANPRLISEAADKFGRQCVVVAIDAKRRPDGSGWNIYKNGGRVDRESTPWRARTVDRLGAGEILLTSMDCDGTKAGYDNS